MRGQALRSNRRPLFSQTPKGVHFHESLHLPSSRIIVIFAVIRCFPSALLFLFRGIARLADLAERELGRRGAGAGPMGLAARAPQASLASASPAQAKSPSAQSASAATQSSQIPAASKQAAGAHSTSKSESAAVAHPASSDKASAERRAEAFQEAMKAGAALKSTWPATPQAVVADFWSAAARKDWARILLLCPGTLESDFKPHFDKWTPEPPSSVGAAERHPIHKDVALYPVKINFPGYPNKTIKMAVRSAPDGRLIIDGENSIWW